MKGGVEPATLESQVEHSTTEPKPLLIEIAYITKVIQQRGKFPVRWSGIFTYQLKTRVQLLVNI